jgi:hypothetical protein
VKYQILVVDDATNTFQKEKICDTREEAVKRKSVLEKIYPEYNILIDEIKEQP